MSGLKIPRTLRLPTMLVAVAQVQPALAQDDFDDGTRILVTSERPAINPYGDEEAPYKVDRLFGERQVVPLLDLPRTVVAIPKEVIEDQGALSFRDLIRTQAGITLGTGEGGNAYGDRMFIRGFDARNDVYVDGFRDPGVTQRELFAVQQVEVIKGPNATYGGRGTTGGSVNFVTKAPQDSIFAAFNATTGTDNTRRISTDLNYSFGESFQVRANALYHASDVAGRDYVWHDRWGMQVAARFAPSEEFQLTGDYYHLTWDTLPDWGFPFDSRTQQPFTDAPRDNWYGVFARDFLTTKVDIGTVKLAWDAADNIRISSIGRYSWGLNRYIASAPEGPQITDPNPANWTTGANPKSRNAKATFWGNQTQARVDFDTAGIDHKLVVGGEYSSEQVVNRPLSQAISETVGTPITPAVAIRQNIFQPNPYVPWVSATGVPLVPIPSGARTDAEIESWALFALDTIEITPQLQISGGVRYDNFQIEVLSLGAPSATNPNPVPTIVSRKDEFVNWNAGIVYKPYPDISLYASAATSSNPSGEQTDAATNASYGGIGPQNLNLGPEKNRAYEIGVKWEPGGHILLTAALFRTTKLNARVATTGVATYSLDGKQRAQGVELGVSGNITPEWSVFGGFVYLDTEVLEANNPVNVGARFPNQPEYSAALLTTYALTDWLTLGGQASYYSTRYGGSNQTNSSGTVSGGVVVAQPTLPAYWRFDATARIQVLDEVELQINGLNLTDERYFEALYQSASPFSYQAPGRSVMLTARVVL